MARQHIVKPSALVELHHWAMVLWVVCLRQPENNRRLKISLTRFQAA
ncbi:hypothetical protein [Kingella oralis]